MISRPPTWGSTARLALWGMVGALVCTGAILAVVLDLARGVEADAAARVEALRALTLIGPAALGTIATLGSVGAAIHGARHLGGPPAPTSAEIRTFTAPTPAGPGEP